MDLIECTNWYGTRRHLSADLQPEGSWPGKRGRALCSAEVWDEAGINSQHAKKRFVLADIPPCVRCETSRKRLEKATAKAEREIS